MNRRDSPKDLFPAANDSELQGVVERVVFASEESGWTVLRLKCAGKTGLQTVVGPLYGVQPGETLRITGEWVEDPKFGRQYRAQSYLALEPKTLGGLESYIGSGLIPGVGKVMAKRIVDRFGLETLEVLDHEPKRLREVEGIGRHRAGKIQAAWEQQREARDVMVFLRSYGVTPSQALKISRRYGKDSVRLVKSNPYRLAGELHGIGFLTADQIAERLGVARDSPARARAGIDHVLSLAEREGHVFLPRSELLSRTRALLDQEGDVVEAALTKSLRQGNLVEETAITMSI